MKTFFYVIISMLLIVFGCSNESNQPTAPAINQGPSNTSFETEGDWLVTQSYGYSTRQTGTGFMPTKGSWFMNMQTNTTNNFFSGSTSIYQENIYFDKSDSMLFDYTLHVYGNDTYCTATIEFLFTVNGTLTLWSKTYTGPISIDTQQLNEAVALPSMPDKGKLTIKLSAQGGQNVAAGFQIDNLRVK